MASTKVKNTLKKTWVVVRPAVPYVIGAGVLYFGGKALLKKIGKGLLPNSPNAVDTATDDEQKYSNPYTTTETTTNADGTTSTTTINNPAQVASYDNTSYTSMADNLNNSLDTAFSPDMDNITAVFNKMNNDLDVAKLIKAFGTKVHFRLFPKAGAGNYTLPEFLTFVLSATNIATINQILSDKGIKFQF